MNVPLIVGKICSYNQVSLLVPGSKYPPNNTILSVPFREAIECIYVFFGLFDRFLSIQTLFL